MSHCNKQIAGIGLIELMIIIVIVGVFSTIAIPTYYSYMMKSRVSELVSLTRAPKLAVEEYVAINAVKNTSDIPAAANFQDLSNPTRYATSVRVTDGGVVEVRGTDVTGPTTILLIPTIANDYITWTCQATPKTYAPTNCQN